MSHIADFTNMSAADRQTALATMAHAHLTALLQAPPPEMRALIARVLLDLRDRVAALETP